MTTTITKCKWTGKSGKEYIYEIYPISTNWNDVAANYIFAKSTGPTTWEPVYIGETHSLKERLPNHNELPCIGRHGGSHVHVHQNANKHVRLAEEADLLANNISPCNG